MSMASTYDVIIAGGGPAGSTAGYLLSTSGLRVLIIDKKKFPRAKVCAGLITHKTVQLLERVFGESTDSLKRQGIINNESDYYEVFSRHGLIARGKTGIPFRFVERTAYDPFFLRKAGEAGADIIEGDGVRQLEVLRSRVITESGQSHSANIIIGADGVNSRIRRSFPTGLFGRDEWTTNLAAAHEILISRDRMQRQIDHPALYFDFTEYGYAWVFPHRDTVKIGICGLRNRDTMSMLAAFRDFISFLNIPGASGERIFSAVSPYGNFLPEPVFRNIMLIGDAAGLADPLLGEGIYYAQRSAELAAHAILNTPTGRSNSASPAQQYLESLGRYILPEMIYAGKIRRMIFTHLKKLHWSPLKLLMPLLGSMPIETVHGIRSYQWMKKSTDV